MKTFRVRVNGKEYEVEVEETGRAKRSSIPQGEQRKQQPTAVTTPRVAHSAIASTPASIATTTGPADGKITAPMPGTILKITCKDGETVKKGETILVLEAMKMENDIQAPVDCKIDRIAVAEGQSVNAGDVLVQLAI